MGKPTLDEISQIVIDVVLPFYAIERDMPLPVGNRRDENDAEHSWSLALLCCALAPHIDDKLDVGKIAQFAIVHDLVELGAGDTSVWDDEAALASKEAREMAALEELAVQFSHFPWIADTIREYEQKTSAEVNFVWATDKLLALLIRFIDRGRYYLEEGITKERFLAGLVRSKTVAHKHPEIGQYYDELLALFAEHPDYFYRDNNSS